jgi:hypothetical protein
LVTGVAGLLAIPDCRVLRQLRCVKGVGIAALLFGLIKGLVSVVEQGFGVLAVIGIERDAKAGADVDGVVIHVEGRLEAGNEAIARPADIL